VFFLPQKERGDRSILPRFFPDDRGAARRRIMDAVAEKARSLSSNTLFIFGFCQKIHLQGTPP
jgi:hypothetical protein